MLNRIILIGRLTRDPESQYTPSGVPIAKFAIAVDRFSKNPETGEKEADFINIVAFRKTAEFVTQYVGKGRLVCVEGRLQIRPYVDKDGQKRSSTEVIADSVQPLDRPRDSDSGTSDYSGGESAGGYRPAASSGGYAPPAGGYSPAPVSGSAPVHDDFDPFADE